MSFFTSSSSSSSGSSSSSPSSSCSPSTSSSSEPSSSFPFHNMFFTDFRSFSQGQKLNLLSILILCSTPEYIHYELHDLTPEELSQALSTTWIFPLIYFLAIELSISQELLENLLPLLLQCISFKDGLTFLMRQNLVEEKLFLLDINAYSNDNIKELIDGEIVIEDEAPYEENKNDNNKENMKNSNQNNQKKINLLISLIFFLIFHSKYDGRGRSLIRTLAFFLSIPSEKLIFYEREIRDYLFNNTEKLNNFLLSSHKKLNNNNSLMRYAKIGVVSLGAGAVLAVTGGLAAPAIAGALLVMGTSSAAVGVVTLTTMATIFGSAGAGLSGYKMMKRTKGVTEFEFESSGESKSLSIMICISGWEEDEEDYKRAFGTLPMNMKDEERLARFYRIHSPHRLDKITNELKMFSNDINGLYDQIKELYGADPRSYKALVPKPYSYELDENDEEVLNNIFNIVNNALNSTQPQNRMKMSLFGSKQKNSSSSGTSSKNTSIKNLGSEIIRKVDEESIDKYPSTYWHWNELPLSLTEERYLLRWETKLQIQLGNTINNMLTQLGTSTVKHILTTTLLTALAAAVALPAIILKLTDIIDSQWAIAIERADEAGKELAKALLENDYGSRPITLIGYSFGSRVIFSCLRELKKMLGQENELEVSDDTPEGEINEEDGNTNNDIIDSSESSRNSESKSRSNSSSTSGSAKKPSILSKMNFMKTSSTTSSNNPETQAASEKKIKIIRSLIQDVVLLGAPIKASSRSWASVRELVGGRFINGYSSNDMILGIIYR